MSEQVYCLPSKALPPPQQQVIRLVPEMYQRLTQEGAFVLRDDVEEDEAYRQIVPYAVICQDDRVLLVERLKAGSEARLHSLLSIGLGGHINPVDYSTARDVIEAALLRELSEELVIKAYSAHALGLIHRAENAVERVHTGVLYHVEVAEAVTIREHHKLAGEMVSWEVVASKRERLEGWSQAALAFLRP